MYASRITPRQQEHIAKLVGRKCSLQCYLNDKLLEVLWDTRTQVSIVSEGFLKASFHPSKYEILNSYLVPMVLLACKQEMELISHIVGGQRLV